MECVSGHSFLDILSWTLGPTLQCFMGSCRQRNLCYFSHSFRGQRAIFNPVNLSRCNGMKNFGGGDCPKKSIKSNPIKAHKQVNGASYTHTQRKRNASLSPSLHKSWLYVAVVLLWLFSHVYVWWFILPRDGSYSPPSLCPSACSEWVSELCSEQVLHFSILLY